MLKVAQDPEALRQFRKVARLDGIVTAPEMVRDSAEPRTRGKSRELASLVLQRDDGWVVRRGLASERFLPPIQKVGEVRD